MLATSLVDVDALWHVLLFSFAGALGLTTAYGTLVIALDRRERSAAGSGSRTGWLVAAGAAGLICLAIALAGLWAMTQK